MAPVIKLFQRDESVETHVCVTGQHKEMLYQVLDFFEIIPDSDLELMRPNQTLFDITTAALKGLEPIVKQFNPDYIFVQGDTTTAFVGALAGFYEKRKVCHLEAGLRSHDLHSPFPEEGNRKLVGNLAQYHFAPTDIAVDNLKSEQASGVITKVGNTVIDALLLGLDIIKKNESDYRTHFENIDLEKKIILVTGHRRESFGEPFENICKAIKTIASNHPEIEIVYPVHLNPNVREVVGRVLSDLDNVKLIEPLDYPRLIWLMNQSHIVLTDSGGIQEEAPSLGKPVLVMRDVTERMEGVHAGTAKLVGTDYDKIVSETELLLTDQHAYETMAKSVNPYGDGTTSQQVLDYLKSI